MGGQGHGPGQGGGGHFPGKQSGGSGMIIPSARAVLGNIKTAANTIIKIQGIHFVFMILSHIKVSVFG
jgi:hypothetical protein